MLPRDIAHDERVNLSTLLTVLRLPHATGTTAALVAIALAALILMDLQVTDSRDVRK